MVLKPFPLKKYDDYVVFMVYPKRKYFRE